MKNENMNSSQLSGGNAMESTQTRKYERDKRNERLVRLKPQPLFKSNRRADSHSWTSDNSFHDLDEDNN